MTHFAPLLLPIVALTVQPLPAHGLEMPGRAPLSCTAFFVGNWAGVGKVTEFGPPMQVASTASYRADGSFASTTRYRGPDKTWTEQKLAGTWSAAQGKPKGTCTLSLKSVTAAGESSSTTDVTIVDADTYRSFGVDIKRVR